MMLRHREGERDEDREKDEMCFPDAFHSRVGNLQGDRSRGWSAPLPSQHSTCAHSRVGNQQGDRRRGWSATLPSQHLKCTQSREQFTGLEIRVAPEGTVFYESFE